MPKFLTVLLSVLALAAVSLAAHPLLGELRVQADRGNVVANHLAGTWELERELTEKLGAKPWVERLEFTPDESVLEGLPAALTEPFGEMRIWQAGVVIWVERGASTRYPYLLVTHLGNPRVVVFRSRDGKELDDAESCLLSIAPGAEPAKDLLFVGGDFDNESFKAFRRAPDAH